MAQALTSLASFKRWYNLDATVTADDQLLNDLINDATTGIISYLDRKSFFKNTYAEYIDGTGGNKIMLRQWPVIAVSSVIDTGNTVSAGSYSPLTPGWFLAPWDGFLPGALQSVNYIEGRFCRGIKNVLITYTAGYSISGEAGTIPAAPYQITAAQPQGAWGQDDGVTIAGVAATPVAAAPVTGQYAVQAGVYTFAAADTGKAVALSYSYTPSVVQTAANMYVGEMYSYRQHIGQKSRTMTGAETTAFDNSIMTAAVMNKLQPYKRMVPF